MKKEDVRDSVTGEVARRITLKKRPFIAKGPGFSVTALPDEGDDQSDEGIDATKFMQNDFWNKVIDAKRRVKVLKK